MKIIFLQGVVDLVDFVQRIGNKLADVRVNF